MDAPLTGNAFEGFAWMCLAVFVVTCLGIWAGVIEKDDS